MRANLLNKLIHVLYSVWFVCIDLKKITSDTAITCEMNKAMNWITSSCAICTLKVRFKVCFFYYENCAKVFFASLKCAIVWMNFSRHLAHTPYRFGAVAFSARDFVIDFHLNRTQSLQWTKRKWYYVTVALVDVCLTMENFSIRLEIFEPCQNMSVCWKCFSNELETRVMIIKVH